MAHANAQIMKRAYDAFNSGDMDTLREIFSPEIVGHVPGKSSISGDYKGVDEVFGLFGKLVELTAGNYKAEVHDILATDEHAVVLSKTTGSRPDGMTHQANSVEVFHLSDGKVTEFWTLEEDQYRADEFYS